MRVLSIFFLSFVPICSHPFSESQLTDLRPIEAFYQTRTPGEFLGHNGVKLSYSYFANRGANQGIVICPGWSEPSLKYAELAQDFFAKGYSVWILDHRGQGLSGRMIPDSRGGYVDSYKDYVVDFDTFMKSKVLPDRPKKLFLFAHSMGAAVCTIYTDYHPRTFNAVVLSAPMFGVQLSGLSQGFVESILDGLLWMGFGSSPVLGDKHLGPQKIENSTTHSQARFRVKELIYEKYPETKVSYPTYKWLRESLKMTEAISSIPAQHFYPRTLLLQAGKDHLVYPEPQVEFCKRARACAISTFPEARHEILNETDNIRSSALDRILKFYQTDPAEAPKQVPMFSNLNGEQPEGKASEAPSKKGL
jgi:lysophospholipase